MRSRRMRRGAWLAFLVAGLLPCVALAETEFEALRADVEALKQRDALREAASLQAEAEAAVTAAPEGHEALALKTFKGGERSLQALNPELSVVGDLFGRFVYHDGQTYSPEGGRSGFFPRVMGVHVQSNLDPFSLAKVVVGVSPAGVELGEAYVTWTAVAPGLSLTVGKFHQQFGVVNRWHAPGLDQFGYPLVLTEHFGGPLNQAGVSLLVTLPPLWADHQEVEVQVTNGQNARLFAGEFFAVPSGLVHTRSYWDLDRDTYLELGLSGLAGANNAWGQKVDTPAPGAVAPTSAVKNDDDWRLTAVGGADLTLNWEPLNQAKYLGVTWRTELLYAYKQVAAATGPSAITSWGLYSYLQVKPFQNWIFGVRGDLSQAFVLDNGGHYSWGAIPYITWWQSPWVRLRLEYEYLDWAEIKGLQPEHRVFLQVTFSAGPHKHERY